MSDPLSGRTVGRPPYTVDLKAAVLKDVVSTPEGRAQLKQMIEEAEKEELTLDAAIEEHEHAARIFERDVHEVDAVRSSAYKELAATVSRLKAAAQREYGKVGVKSNRIRAVRITHDTTMIETDPDSPKVLIATADIPGILYALSTLEET